MLLQKGALKSQYVGTHNMINKVFNSSEQASISVFNTFDRECWHISPGPTVNKFLVRALDLAL